MPRYQYRCTECDTAQPVDFVSEDRFDGEEYPPDEVVSICGERWGGCGTIERLVRVE